MIAVSWGQSTERKPRPGTPIRPLMEAIIHAVAVRHAVTMEQIRSPGRGPAECAVARQEAYYRCWQTGASLKAIARMFSNRDHSTILHGVRLHQKRMEQVPRDIEALPITPLSTDCPCPDESPMLSRQQEVTHG